VPLFVDGIIAVDCQMKLSTEKQATMPPIRRIIHWPNPIKNGLQP